jgi:uncharacterized membrane protein
MQGIVEFLKGSGLHPVVDHFTVALVLVAILIDLVASLMPARTWLRSTAALLMLLGALAAAGSKVTGGWEAERVWEHLTGPAKDTLKSHAQLGEYLTWGLAGLALWRLAIQFIGFLASTRFIYLIVALIAGGLILYQGDMGGDLVYQFGVGTALTNTETPAQSGAPTPALEPTPMPTVYAPPANPVAPEPTAATMSSPPASNATPAMPAPSASPAASPATPVNPPPGPAAMSPPGSPPTALSSPASTSRTL